MGVGPMGTRLATLVILFTVICAVVGLTLPATSQVSLPYGPGGFASTAGTGSTPTFSANGINTVTITFYTGGGATFTIEGAGDQAQGGTFVTNTNCGTNGIITNPSNNSLYYCSLAGYPLGFKIHWTGNTGTVFLQVAVSNAVSIASPSPIPSFAGFCGNPSGTPVTCVILQTPGPIPSSPVSPQPGYASLEGLFLQYPVGPAPTPLPNALIVGSSSGICSGGGLLGYISYGTNTDDPVIGTSIVGQDLRVGCTTTGSGGFTHLALNDIGNLAIGHSLYTGPVGGGVASIFVQGGNGIEFPGSSSSGAPCDLLDHGGPAGVQLVHKTTGTCTFLLSDLAASSTLCTDSNSAVTTSCGGTGGNFSNLVCSSPIVCSPSAGPSPAISCPTCGTGGSGVNLQTAGATPTPQVGTVGLTDGLWIGPAPAPQNTIMPNAIRISTTGGGGSFARWGTNTSTVQGIAGTTAYFNNGSSSVAIDSNGSIGASNNIIGNAFAVANSGFFNFPTSSSTGQGCHFNDNGFGGYLQLKHSGTGTCSIQMNDIGVGFSATCFDTNGAFNSCSLQSQNEGEVVCTTVSAASCTQTATVRSGAKCQATMETSDSTLAGPYYNPGVHTSGTTLTVTMTAFVAGSANLAANYWCP